MEPTNAAWKAEYSLLEAEAIVPRSKDTLRRLLRSGALKGAYRMPGVNGPWRIPLQALVEAGLEPEPSRLTRRRAGRPPDREVGPRKAADAQTTVLDEACQDVAVLRERLAAAERAVDAQAAHIHDLRDEVAMLRQLCLARLEEKPDGRGAR